MRKYLFLFFGVLLALSSCTVPKGITMAKDQSIVVTPNPILVDQNTINFEVSVKAPRSMIKKGATYSIFLFLRWKDNELELTPLTHWTKDSVTLNYLSMKKYSIPYKPEYTDAFLEMQFIAQKGTKSKIGPKLPIAMIKVDQQR